MGRRAAAPRPRPAAPSALALVLAGAVAGMFPTQTAHAYHEAGGEWTPGSAYTLTMAELSLGIHRCEVGVLDELTLGTSPLPWVVGPFFGAVIPNGHVKLRDWFHGPLSLSLGFQALYLDASAVLENVRGQEGAHSSLLALTSTLATSVRWDDRWTTSLELSHSTADIDGDSAGTAFEGSAVLDNLFLTLLVQWRLTRVTAVQLNTRVLLYREAPDFNLSYQVDPFTHLDAELRANFVPPAGAMQVVPAAAFSWKHVNLKLGAGYGYRWLPFLGLAFEPGPVVDVDFFVRF